jgi:hypothetical protein
VGPYVIKDGIKSKDFVQFEKVMNTIAQMKWTKFEKHFSPLAQKLVDTAKKNTAPTITNTGFGNMAVTFNYVSAEHTDDDEESSYTSKIQFCLLTFTYFVRWYLVQRKQCQYCWGSILFP